MTPGLGNIYDAAGLARQAFWLPPTNDSQGQQLRLLLKHGVAPYQGDWHELNCPEVPFAEVDYFGDQQEVIKQLAHHIQSALDNQVPFSRALKEKATAALRDPTHPTVESTALYSVVFQRFGSGGDR